MHDFRSHVAVRCPVYLVLDGLEEQLRRFHLRSVIDAGRVNVEHLSPEDAFGRANVTDAGQQFFEVLASAGGLEARVVHRETLDEVFTQTLGCPNTKQFVGVFTEKDCLRVLVNAAYEQLPTMQIYAFVQTKTQTVSEETDILTIAQIFLSNAFRRLPVVRGDRVVGQISRRDVLSAVSSVKSPHAEHHKARLLYLSSLVALEDAPIS